MIALLAVLALAAAPIRPNPVTTPGVINPAVTQANIAATICVSGWTATIRPPASYTNALKRRQMVAVGLTGKPALFEEDHFISLEIGGHPTDPRNLWPEPWAGSCGAHAKDRLENFEHRAVCSGAITLAQAQHEIATDWTAAYAAHIGPLRCAQ